MTGAEARPESVAKWNAFVHEKAEGLLSNEIDSWMTGVNMNVEGKQTRTVVRYSGTAPEYRAKCDEVAASGYESIDLTSHPTLTSRSPVASISKVAGIA